jgi:hypothetical protein
MIRNHYNYVVTYDYSSGIVMLILTGAAQKLLVPNSTMMDYD